MRAIIICLVFLLLLPGQAVHAQDLVTPSASLALVPTSAEVFGTLIPADSVNGARDRGRGALRGAAIGALVGGVGFAAANYVFTESSPRDEYSLLSFALGAAVGGGVGAVVGGIIGVPGREETRSEQARLHVLPALSRGGSVAVSVSLPSR